MPAAPLHNLSALSLAAASLSKQDYPDNCFELNFFRGTNPGEYSPPSSPPEKILWFSPLWFIPLASHIFSAPSASPCEKIFLFRRAPLVSRPGLTVFINRFHKIFA